MNWSRHVFLVFFIGAFSGNLLASVNDLKFATKLSKTYPKMALRYMERNKLSLINDDRSKYNKVMYNINYQLGNFSPTVKFRLESFSSAKEYLFLSNVSAFEKADGLRRFANILEMDLLDYRLAPEMKIGLLENIDNYYTKSSFYYHKVVSQFDKRYEEGLDNAINGGRVFMRSNEFRDWQINIYQPFAESSMRVFECTINNLWLQDSKNLKADLLINLAEKASDAAYKFFSMVPPASLNVSEGRMFGLLAFIGEAKSRNEYKEKSLELFNMILEKKPVNPVDRKLLVRIKKEAVHGKIELGLIVNDISLIEKTFSDYRSTFNENKFGYKDYQIYAKTMKMFALKTKEIKSEILNLKINDLKSRLLKKTASSPYWKRKSYDLILRIDSILGFESKNAAVLFRLARDYKHQENYIKAAEYFAKAFSVSSKRKSSTVLKNYYSWAFCYYKMNKNQEGVDALDHWFQGLSTLSNPQKKVLKDITLKAIELNSILSKRIYLNNKSGEKLKQFEDSLLRLATVNPEKVIFEKSDLYFKTDQVKKAIAELSKIKDDSVNRDKALFLKGYIYYRQFDKMKKVAGNDEFKLAGKKTLETLSLTKAYLEAISGVLSKKKIAKRSKWLSDTNRFTGYTLFKLNKLESAIDVFTSVLLSAKESEKLSLIRVLFSSYSKKNNAKDLDKCEELFLSMKTHSKTSAEQKKLMLYMRNVGLMFIKNGETEKGVKYLVESFGKNHVKNLDLYIAQQFLGVHNHRGAKAYYLKVLENYDDLGYSTPLKRSDFQNIQDSFVLDKDLNFFKDNFVFLAVNKNKKESRDLTKLRKNMFSLLKETEDQSWNNLKSQNVWHKNIENNNFQKLASRLESFLKYLGTIDDLCFCSIKLKEFDDSLKYLNILKHFYPGVLSQEKQSANLLFEAAKFNLMKGKMKKGLAQMNQAKDEFVKLKIRLKRKKGTDLYREVNENRLLSYLWIYQYTKDQKVMNKIHLALSILFSDQIEYRKYVSLLDSLSKQNLLPKELKPLSDRAIKIQANDLKKLAKKRHDEKIKKILIFEELALLKRNNSTILLDCSFKSLEFNVMNQIDLIQLKNIFRLIKPTYKEVSDVPLYLIMTEKFNELLIDIDMKNKIPKKDLLGNDINPILIQMNKFILRKGRDRSVGHNKIILWNRQILKICYPLIPPLNFKVTSIKNRGVLK
ncbi:MAG: hypothetical protein COA79_23390 [Planctomycetota bacterium]|nr:MAG: hypothetical protein COA79_23390 [Planctomycetota bacterium]